MRQSTYNIPDAGDHVRIVAIHPDDLEDRQQYIGKSALVVRDHNTLPRGRAPEDGFGAAVLDIDGGHLVYFHGVKVELDTTAQANAEADRELAFQLADELAED